MDVNENFALNIPIQGDVKLNELPKQIFMLLPLLLHWLYFFILGGLPPPRMKKSAAPFSVPRRVKATCFNILL